MIITYTLPRAEENILAGVKLHTFREDKKRRWRPGLKIQHSYSFRSKGGYRCFLENECRTVQEVLMILVDGSLHMVIDRKRIPFLDQIRIAHNDGFNSLQDLISWFFKDKKNEPGRWGWSGRIIHWTDTKY